MHQADCLERSGRVSAGVLRACYEPDTPSQTLAAHDVWARSVSLANWSY